MVSMNFYGNFGRAWMLKKIFISGKKVALFDFFSYYIDIVLINLTNGGTIMSNVRRVYAEKKPDFAVAAKDLKSEIKSYLGIKTVTNVRVLIRYDIENISDDTYEKAKVTVFSEPPVDDLYEETFDAKGAAVFSV